LCRRRLRASAARHGALPAPRRTTLPADASLHLRSHGDSRRR
jgi:hypothetical protein